MNFFSFFTKIFEKNQFLCDFLKFFHENWFFIRFDEKNWKKSIRSWFFVKKFIFLNFFAKILENESIFYFFIIFLIKIKKIARKSEFEREKKFLNHFFDSNQIFIHSIHNFQIIALIDVINAMILSNNATNFNALIR